MMNLVDLLECSLPDPHPAAEVSERFWGHKTCKTLGGYPLGGLLGTFQVQVCILWCGNDEGNLGCQVLFCYQAALRQLLEFGLFHGDPHAGNIFAMDDGRCTG